jgi:hypothetical protein
VRAVPRLWEFYLAFVLQLRKKHGKTSVRVRKTPSQVKKNLSRSTVYIYIPRTHILSFKTYVIVLLSGPAMGKERFGGGSAIQFQKHEINIHEILKVISHLTL